MRESKNNGASFRKSVRMFGSTGLEPNKIFGSVLWSAAVPRSFQHCNQPIHRDSVWCQSTNSGEASGCRFAFRNPVVQASLVCSLTISSTSCQSAPRRKSSSSECCLERKSRASILDWVSIGKPKFTFSFCLFVERRKVRRRRERKWKR